jgi:NADH dehydrogenase [ubiquinone] 1 alpha subcomplex assembly factor 7
MSALGDIIRAMIVEDGPMSLERYMGLALGHPKHGYYMTRDPFGASGDFITSPEISQMFGELIGIWCAEYWSRMGAPKKLNLVELGPGRGTLMRDALRAGRVVPEFFNAVDVYMVEMSPVLREAQRTTLADAGRPVAWRESFAEVPAGPVIVIANEFFDALPARHYVKSRGGWRERVIGMAPNGKLLFGAGLQFESSLRVEAPEGSIIEINAIAQRMTGEIAGRIASEGGAALIIDYGYVATSLGETLQAMRGHARSMNRARRT